MAGIGAGYLSASNFDGFLAANAYIRHVELSNWGEVFLNPELLDILHVARHHDVTLGAASGVNLNHLDAPVAEALVTTRFEVLQVAIDGADNEAYIKYRAAGNLERVLDNLKLINSFKARYGSRYPRLIWQFIPFGHNEHQLADARRMASKLGMEFRIKLSWEGLYLDKPFSPVTDHELIRNQTGLGVSSRQEFYEKHNIPFMQKHICAMLWHRPQINWDGRMLGCCVNYWGDFGDAFKSGLAAVMSGPRMSHARAMIMGRADARADIPCSTCPHYISIRQARSWITAPELAQLMRG